MQGKGHRCINCHRTFECKVKDCPLPVDTNCTSCEIHLLQVEAQKQLELFKQQYQQIKPEDVEECGDGKCEIGACSCESPVKKGNE